jgi:hypothetical protein
MRRMRATFVREIGHDPRLLAATQGNMQLLPDGHYFVGWGARPYFTEYDSDGRSVLFDARFGYRADSYRAYRFPWTGHPGGRPAIAVAGGTAYVSWNGATEVARWQLLSDGHPAASVANTGFESAIPIPSRATRIAVRALARDGTLLATTRTLSVP